MSKQDETMQAGAEERALVAAATAGDESAFAAELFPAFGLPATL